METTTLLQLDKIEICREENVILRDASFTLHNGEFVYVIGKVGSGKSSLLKSLYCEIPIKQGASCWTIISAKSNGARFLICAGSWGLSSKIFSF